MSETKRVPTPSSRRLRIFSFDPGLATQYDTSGISEITIKVPWEQLEQGPIGEYVEVIDLDPASGALYRPVDLDRSELLASDGLAPSESDPQFHQQMVYAVAMTTIGHFERALGRVALWALAQGRPTDGYRRDSSCGDCGSIRMPCVTGTPTTARTRRRCSSATFRSRSKDAYNTPGTLVFTCLSHDIIAHETTHALLDGVHPRFNEPTNADVLAFHEAFADIVALFQHFSYPGVLRDQIARTRGRSRQREHAGPAGAAVRAGCRATAVRFATPWAASTRRPGSGSHFLPIRRPGIDQRTPRARRYPGRRRLRRVPKVYRARTRRSVSHRHRGNWRPARGRHPPRPGRATRRGSGACRDLSPDDVHPRHRLLSAGGHHLRRLPSRDRHRRPRPQSRGRIGLPASPSLRASASGGSIRAIFAACLPRD